MKVTLKTRRGRAMVNVEAHHNTWRRAWREIQQDWISASAAKYVDVRRAFGVYVVDGPEDAIQVIYRALLLAK